MWALVVYIPDLHIQEKVDMVAEWQVYTGYDCHLAKFEIREYSMTSYIWTPYIQQSTTSKMVAISNLFSWARETMQPHGLMAVVYGIVVGLGVIGKYGAMEKWIIVSCNKSHCMTRPLVTGHLHVLDYIRELFGGLRIWSSLRLST
jgi:hypothetical protein